MYVYACAYRNYGGTCMKKYINWKVLLVLVLVVCFVFAIVACDSGGSGKKNNNTTKKEEETQKEETKENPNSPAKAIDAIFAALDTTLPSTSEKTSVLSLGANIGVDFDGFNTKVNGQAINWDGVSASVNLMANFDANTSGNNAAKISVKYKTTKEQENADELVSIYTLGSTAYLKIKDHNDYYKVNVGDNGADKNNVDYVKYLKTLPSTLGATIGGLNVASLKESLMGVISSVSDMLGDFLDCNVGSDAISIRLVLGKEENFKGIQGSGVASLLSGFLKEDGLIGAALVSIDSTGEIYDIVMNDVVPVLLGASLFDICDPTKDLTGKLSQVNIVLNKDASGAISGLNIVVTAGEKNENWQGTIKLNIADLKVSDKEDTTVKTEIEKFDAAAKTPAIHFDVNVDIPNNTDLCMTLGFDASPSIVDGDMLIQLTSASLPVGEKTFDANDLCAVYDVVDGQRGVWIDLLALYKVAYKDEIAAGTFDLTSTNTQYFLPIEIENFIYNLYSKKYVLVGYAGNWEHGNYEYCWFEDGNDSWSLDKLTTNVKADTELMAKIRKAYGVADTEDIELVIADYWWGDINQGIKFVIAYPKTTTNFATINVKSFNKETNAVDKVSSIKLVNDGNVTLNEALSLVDYTISGDAIGSLTFVGWEKEDGTAVDPKTTVLNDGDTVVAKFEDFSKLSDGQLLQKMTFYAYEEVNGNYEYAEYETLYFVQFKSKKSETVYWYNTETKEVSTTAIFDKVADVTAPKSPVYGIKFAGWKTLTSANDTTLKDVSKTAKDYGSDVKVYAVYELDNELIKEDTVELVGEGVDYSVFENRFNTVIAKGTQTTDKKTPMFDFTGESTDIVALALSNVQSALDVIANKEVSSDTLLKVLRGIKDFGIAENDSDAVAREKISNWVLYLVSRADSMSADRVYTYKTYSTAVKYADITKAVATLDEKENQFDAIVDYLTYLRYVGIYGNLDAASAETLGLKMDATATDYADLTDKKAKASKYEELENLAQIAALNGDATAHDLAYYENLVINYIKGYLGETAMTGIDSVSEFIFGDGSAVQPISIKVEYVDAKLVLTAKRGTQAFCTFRIGCDLVDVTTLNADKVDMTRFDSTKALDIRSWAVSEIVDFKLDGVAVDLSTWTNDQIARLSTESIVDTTLGTIVFEGKTYTFNAAKTRFVAAIVKELEELNLKMSGQK